MIQAFFLGLSILLAGCASAPNPTDPQTPEPAPTTWHLTPQCKAEAVIEPFILQAQPLATDATIYVKIITTTALKTDPTARLNSWPAPLVLDGFNGAYGLSLPATPLALKQLSHGGSFLSLRYQTATMPQAAWVHLPTAALAHLLSDLRGCQSSPVPKQ